MMRLMLKKKMIYWLVAGVLLAACSVNINATTPNATTPVPTVFVPNVVPPGYASATPGQIAGTPAPKWSALGLKGYLIYSLGVQGIQKLDLSNGKVTTIFMPPQDGWLTASTITPDGKQIAVAYGPPPATGQPRRRR